eukprot:1127484_1
MFDASQSHDMDGKPCVSFEWDFGDGSPKKRTKEAVTQHPFGAIGHYPTTVTVTDKHGQKDKAHTNTQVTDTDPAKTSRIDVIRPPVAVLESDPKETCPREAVDFDASKSKDMYGKPCVSYTWDFGDHSPHVTTKEAYTKHPYQKIGHYPVTVTVKDRNGLTDAATVQQKVSQTIPARASTEWDPINSFESISPVQKTDPCYASFVDSVYPPTAHLEGNPKVTSPNELVDFDASRSHDWQGKPCVEFTFDFGDNSPQVTQQSPFVKHPYNKIGHYPVSVEVKDKNGLTGKAHCNQKCIDSDPASNSRVDVIYPPYAHVVGVPPQTKPNVAVDFDASKSKDMYGKPCVSYTWDFGDHSPHVTTKEAYTKHPYQKIGHYPVTVTVKDRNGLTDAATVQQKVSQTIPARASTEWDPINSFESISPVQKTDPCYASFVDSVYPPTAHLEGNPKVTSPNELVDFDASRSHDWQGKPCVEFTFDFGDNSPQVTQQSPFVKHPYNKIGHYPVSVEVKDKNGLTGKAHCNQKCIDSDPASNSRVDVIYPPYAHVVGVPPQTKPNVAVDFDAS